MAQSGRRISTKPVSTSSENGDTLKIGTVEVSLSITVRDSLGKSVHGLQADDFFIYDNGRRYQPAHFEHRHVPVNLVLLLDATGSFFGDEETIRRALLAFRRNLASTDRIAVMHFAGEIVLAQDWDNNEALLRDTIRFNRRPGKAAIYDALLLAAAKLNEAEGRRAILLLTSGLNTTGLVRFDEALAAVQSANAAVYVFSETEAIANTIRQNQRKEFRIAASLPALESAERKLTLLAEQSGGSIYFPLKEGSLDWMLADVANELRAQYLITYQPSDEAEETSGYHKVEVLVNGSHKAHTRPGYVRQKFPDSSKLINSPPRLY